MMLRIRELLACYITNSGCKMYDNRNLGIMELPVKFPISLFFKLEASFANFGGIRKCSKYLEIF
jgi:hypothetical protein